LPPLLEKEEPPVNVSELLGYAPELTAPLRKNKLPKSTNVNSLIAHSLQGIKVNNKIRKKKANPPEVAGKKQDLPSISNLRT